MSASNYDGKSVNVNDQVTIMGVATTITGSGALASVLVTTLREENFTEQARYFLSKQHALSPTVVASSADGKSFSAGDRVNINGVVTAISGDGSTAALTVTLDGSGQSVLVTAGTVRSHG